MSRLEIRRLVMILDIFSPAVLRMRVVTRNDVGWFVFMQTASLLCFARLSDWLEVEHVPKQHCFFMDAELLDIYGGSAKKQNIQKMYA